MTRAALRFLTRDPAGVFIVTLVVLGAVFS